MKKCYALFGIFKLINEMNIFIFMAIAFLNKLKKNKFDLQCWVNCLNKSWLFRKWICFIIMLNLDALGTVKYAWSVNSKVLINHLFQLGSIAYISHFRYNVFWVLLVCVHYSPCYCCSYIYVWRLLAFAMFTIMSVFWFVYCMACFRLF